MKRGLALSVALSAAGTALYRRAQHVAETEQRSVGEVLRELPGRITEDLRTLPDDLRSQLAADAVVARLESDLHWLDRCEQRLTDRRSPR